MFVSIQKNNNFLGILNFALHFFSVTLCKQPDSLGRTDISLFLPFLQYMEGEGILIDKLTKYLLGARVSLLCKIQGTKIIAEGNLQL